MEPNFHNIFDVHAHYYDEWFDEDRESLFQTLPQNGVCNVINAAVDLETAETIKNYSEKVDYFYFAAGFHPENLENLPEDYLERIKPYLSHKKCVALGEIGLDYYWDIPKDKQKKVFEEQLILAKELDIPVIVHDREAHGDTLEMLRKYKPKGILHCFSGSVEMMREVVKLGMSISLGGVVTFKNAKHSVNVASEIPLDRLMLETDAPYMAPVPFRGKRCDSSMIIYCAKKIAELRGLPTQKLLDITKENAEKMFLSK